MKIVVFVVCVLVAITMSDAQNVFESIIQTVTSKAIDLKELIDLPLTLAACTFKMGLSKIGSPEISYCVAEKKNLINEQGEIKWDETLIFAKKIFRDETQINYLNEMIQKCKEEGDKFEGNQYEKTIKSIECVLSMIKKKFSIFM
ncbi:uncharacterized protein LOC105205221 [Solenopsis invicta]|uniref:uncharacterized protein LOC105205221 n=1 Tax=Solenopsis invicta TaxID=13686 RepID=UPI000E33F035|nr:uncharacterized protein LOC105205221 [Solenopsis invicta]